MNWVDLVLVIVLLLAAWMGYRRGFLRGTLDLITWAGSIAIGYLVYPYTGEMISQFASLGAWHLPLAFIITAIVAWLVIGFVVRSVSRRIPETTNAGQVNRFFGIIPGVFNGLVYATVIAAFLLALPLKKSITTETQHSVIARTLSTQAEWANKKLAPVFDQAVRQTMNTISGHPQTHEEVDLHFTCDNPEIRSDLEKKMLEMVNRERIKAGLKPLKADPQQTVVARAHSKDMFVRGYFAHVNPDGQNPFDRMKAAKVKFKTAGENLALAQTLEIAHTNLMNSPGHRANILNPKFGRVGIGIQDGGFYGLMISQEFRN
jgi:uncharacterized protein YkwD